MNLLSLKAKNFRNYINLDIMFNNGINIFVGDNAQGKTNIIEAIYILSSTKTFRKNEENDFINFDKNKAEIFGIYLKSDIKKEVRIEFEKSFKKSIYINSKKIIRTSDYIGNLISVLFSPEDLNLLKGDSSDKRKIVDYILCQTDKEYLFYFIQLNKTVKQRNFFLKTKNHSNCKEELDAWNEQLIKYSKKIFEKRKEYICDLNTIIKNICAKINNKEIYEIVYIDSVFKGEIKENSEYEIELNWLLKNKENIEKEKKLGYTIFGAQKDDLRFLINGLNSKLYASQGQQRSLAIGLRMAESEYIKKITGEYPLILLDDVFSELDDTRKLNLISFLNGGYQVFISGTSIHDLNNVNKISKIFKINEGKIYD